MFRRKNHGLDKQVTNLCFFPVISRLYSASMTLFSKFKKRSSSPLYISQHFVSIPATGLLGQQLDRLCDSSQKLFASPSLYCVYFYVLREQIPQCLCLNIKLRSNVKRVTLVGVFVSDSAAAASIPRRCPPATSRTTTPAWRQSASWRSWSAGAMTQRARSSRGWGRSSRRPKPSWRSWRGSGRRGRRCWRRRRGSGSRRRRNGKPERR